jgi:hypothetical protein
MSTVTLQNSALASVEIVADYLGIDPNVDLPIIERLLNTSTGVLELATGRRLKNRTYTDYRLDGNGRRFIYFDEFPVNTVTSLVTEDSTQQTIETIDVNVLNKKMLIDRRAGKILLMETVFPTGIQNIKLTCTAGLDTTYEEDTMDLSVLEQATILLVQNMYANKGIVDQLMRSERIGDYSYIRGALKVNQILPDFIVMYLENLKRV